MTEQVIDRLSGSMTSRGPEERLLSGFFAMYRTSRIVAANNATFRNRLKDFCDIFQEIAHTSGDVTIKVYSGRYFVNEFRVPLDDKKVPGLSMLVSEWQLLDLGGITFARSIDTDELGRFFELLADIKPNSENVEILTAKLKALKMPNIHLLGSSQVIPVKRGVSAEIRRKFRYMARRVFFQSVSVVQEVVVNAASDKEINIAKTKRVVHALLDQLMQDESSLLELTSLKDFDDYTYAHSTNVCVYSLTTGVRLGLDRPRLSQLGFAALFHDIGKVKLPADLIQKPDAFDEHDWVQMQRHPMLGAKTILRSLKFDEHAARAARGAFEHHINSDYTGYPILHHDKRPKNLFSEILSIVDTFDALTSGRVYLRDAYTPDQVFKKMRFQMHIKFDPFLLKIFNDIVGIYPAGSLVLLSTNELAVILTNNETDKARPFVKIIGDRSGMFGRAIWADLTAEEHSERSIVRLVDPDRYGIDMKDFVLKD